jgi:hypothetical protein
VQRFRPLIVLHRAVNCHQLLYDTTRPSLLTSYESDSFRLQEWLYEIEEARKLREHDRLLLLTTSLFNTLDNLEQLSDLGRRIDNVGIGVKFCRGLFGDLCTFLTILFLSWL